jgi:HK97 family phage prohead protease
MTTLEPMRPEQLLGTPEWRGFQQFEVRSHGNEFIVRGHASLFECVYPVAGGATDGGWDEQVDRRAFDKTLASNPDVLFLINHEGRTLARTKSGTLKLATDSTGLLTEARIDRRTSDGHDLEIRMERGDYDEMSIGFRTIQQSWQGDLRTLLEVSLDKGDVSVVNLGANSATRIAIAPALEALSNISAAEFRRMENPLDRLREARSHIDQLIAQVTHQSGALSVEEIRAMEGRLTLAQAEAMIEGRA